MNKLSGAEKLAMHISKPLFACALFTQERHNVAQNQNIIQSLDGLDKEEDVSSPTMQDSKAGLNFSNFGQLVKPSPFQKFHSDSLPSSTTESSKGQGATSLDSPSHLKSILKQGRKSRYSQGDCRAPREPKRNFNSFEIVHIDE